MAKVGGGRNFGFGKKTQWAGKQALRDRYGEGRYATVAAHVERWGQFAAWAREALGLRDARNIDAAVLAAYGQALADQVRKAECSVSYAQNLLSTVNVVLEALRGDRVLRVSPAALVGRRAHIRTEPPLGLDRDAVHQCADRLRAAGHPRVAAVVELAREFGLREREASMLDCRAALRQAIVRGAVNVTAGTKGGRGHHVDRWVPASPSALECLRRAASEQGTARNLIPDTMTWRQWNDRVHHTWAKARDEFGLGKLHDLRAAYACERYLALTGYPAPVIAGRRLVNVEIDRQARFTVAAELGHGRMDVISTYIGSGR